jgi:FkbM family methyltransferase
MPDGAPGGMPRLRETIAGVRRATARSVHLRERGRFVLRELRKRANSRGVYRLRSSSLRIVLRHDRIDAFLLEEILEHGIYDPPGEIASRLGSPRVIVDLGANIGLATAHFLTRYPDARVIAYEPDPETVSVLRQFAQVNLLGEQLEIVEACAGTADGVASFSSDASPLSRADPNGELRVRQLDVFSHLAQADLVKMDIEGGEWDILEDERFRMIPARALVLEYHVDRDRDGRHARELLSGAGYEVVGGPTDPGTGVLWASRASQPTA